MMIRAKSTFAQAGEHLNLLKTELDLAEVVDDRRGDSPEAVEIGEAVLAEIQHRRSGQIRRRAEILDIAREEHSLELLAIADAQP